MKKKIIGLSAAVVLCALALKLWADSPTYLTANGVAATSPAGATVSTLIIGGDPVLQTRLVFLAGSADTNTAVFTLKSGQGAYVVSSNSAAGTLVCVSQTNGLVTGDTLIVSRANGATNFTSTISSFGSSNNIVLAAACFGITNGDSVYKCGSATTLPIGAVSNKVYTGEAIFVGNKGRPILIQVNGCNYSSADSATVRVE